MYDIYTKEFYGLILRLYDIVFNQCELFIKEETLKGQCYT